MIANLFSKTEKREIGFFVAAEDGKANPHFADVLFSFEKGVLFNFIELNANCIFSSDCFSLAYH